ncbi:MAG: DUF58 domain-containing protein [Thermococcus sp.]|uniref:DUF58 domain-containing protein n=1 Tax=Thermococcus sp. TaxID=35749 RepID=UPI001DF47C91|nr:DUF58 domain-containing protein [Thermococcus sp.]MBO8175033.1 DUF58 domain-containing protein [Thermococcus sp.]
MKREDVLFTLAFLLILEGYLGENIAPALAGLFIILYIYSSRMKAEISIEGRRVLSTSRLEEGKKAKVVLEVENKGKSVFIKPIEENEDFEVLGLEGFFLKEGEKKEITYWIRPKKKGKFILKPLKVIAEDERGLYFREFHIGEETEVDVYPSLDSLKEAVKADYNLRLAELYKKSKYTGYESLDIKDLREYQHGDDFKRIDWKATARLGELIIREFLKESDADVYIFLDNTREMRKGLKKAKIDYASVLALQIAGNLVKKYKVGMVIYDDVNAKLIRAGKNSKQLEIIRRNLNLRGEQGLMSFRMDFDLKFSDKARKFLSKLLPLRKGRKGTKGIFEGLAMIKQPSFLIFITDLSNPSDVYKAIAQARKVHRVLLLSPNPILFYSGELDKETLKMLYERYLQREEILRKFNSLVPTIDLGPSDYLKEIARVI